MPRKRQEKPDDQGPSPQEILLKALNHPVRMRALTILSEKSASPKELAEQLEVPLGIASYHVRVLDHLGLIEIVEEDTLPGTVAHFYRAVKRPPIDQSSWEKVNPSIRSALSSDILECLISDATASLAAGVLDQRQERQVTRTPLLLDEEGWRNVSRIQAEAVDDILKEQTAAAGRLATSDAEAIHAILGILLFEIRKKAEE